MSFFYNSFYSASKNFDLIKWVVISHAVFIIVSHIALTAFSVSGWVEIRVDVLFLDVIPVKFQFWVCL